MAAVVAVTLVVAMAAATGRPVGTSTSSSDSPDDESSINMFSIFDMAAFCFYSIVGAGLKLY